MISVITLKNGKSRFKTNIMKFLGIQSKYDLPGPMLDYYTVAPTEQSPTMVSTMVLFEPPRFEDSSEPNIVGWFAWMVYQW